MAGPTSAKRGYLKVGPASGGVSLVPDARNITFESNSENIVYGGSSTEGFRRRIPGYKDYSLTFEVYAQYGRLAWTYDEGEYIKVEGYSDTGIGISGTFIIERIRSVTDIEGGGLVGITVECAGDGTPGLSQIGA